METVKALSPSDTHFFFEADGYAIDIDAVKIVLFWNEGPATGSISERYDYLRVALSNHYGQDFDLANTYLLLEKACAIIVSLKKTFLGSPNSNPSVSGLMGVPMQN